MQRPRSPPAPDHLPTPEPVRIHKNAFHLPPLLTSSALKMKYSVSYLDLLWVTTSSDINIWKKYENTKYLPSRVVWFEQKRNLSREDDVSWNKRMWKSVKYPSNRDRSRKLRRVSQGMSLGDREGRTVGVHDRGGHWLFLQKCSHCQRKRCTDYKTQTHKNGDAALHGIQHWAWI